MTLIYFLWANCTVISQLWAAEVEEAAHGPFCSAWQHLEEEVKSEVTAAGLIRLWSRVEEVELFSVKEAVILLLLESG